MKIKLSIILGALSAGSMLAQSDSTSAEEYLQLQEQAQLKEDDHNAKIYGELALLKHEGEHNPDYDWSDYEQKKGQLKDRTGKTFNKQAVVFFKASSNSDEERVCYVIDFSLSLKGKKEALLRKEFARSVDSLPLETQFASYMFAGPVWQLGDTLTSTSGQKQYQVTHGENVVNWKAKQVHEWTSDIPTMTAQWATAAPEMKTRLSKQISEQQLVWGTDWSHPLKAAMNMQPLPNVIYFMTDGSCNTANQSAIEIAEIAQQKNVRINAISMMQPQAEKPMRYLAAKTGGDFVIIDKDGECDLQKAGSVECPDLKEKKRVTKKHQSGKPKSKRKKKK